MAIDVQKALSLELPVLEVEVERERLRFFAQSIGETDPTYFDVDAARQAGHADLPVPPTFFFSLSLERPDPLGYLDALGVDLRLVLHGEQGFEYTAMAYAGDKLTLSERIVDIRSKRGGAMELVTKETVVRRGRNPICRATTVVVVRNPEVTA